MFELGEEQKQCLDSVKNFINSDSVAFSIQGFAGVGKSFVTKHIIDHLEKINKRYVLCAPTHKAKVVLERFTGREGVTLHKLLSLSPNLEIFELDFNDLQFMMKKPTLFPKKGIIICDESSMISDDLFDLLIDLCIQNKCKVIFSGDSAQLQAVNNKGCSKVFNLKDKAILSKIYRQNGESGLSTILPILRESIIPWFSDSIGKEGSLICTSDIKEFIRTAIPCFKKAVTNQDILECKILTYTNSRTKAFNAKIKELLFKNNDEYNQFEFLTCYENLEYNDVSFYNSMDYIIIDPPEKAKQFIPGFIHLDGWKLNVYDSSNKVTEELFILSKETPKDYLNSLCRYIEEIRIRAIETKFTNKRESAKYWKLYYQIIKSFTTPMDLYYENRLIRGKSFDSGYAMTSYKAQGSSINNVFIDMKDINKCSDKEVLRQMQYVAVSRTKHNAYILQ